MVTINLYALHHSKEVYGDPYNFRPERWMDSKLNTSLLWMPFGAGPRLCVGKNFSLLEQKVFLAKLLRNYKWELVNKDDQIEIDSRNFIIHTPKNIPVKFTPRFK